MVSPGGRFVKRGFVVGILHDGVTIESNLAIHPKE